MTSAEKITMRDIGTMCPGVHAIVEHTHGWPVTSVSALADKKAHLAGRSYGGSTVLLPTSGPIISPKWEACGGQAQRFLKSTCSTHGVPAIRADLLPEVLAEIAGWTLVHWFRLARMT